MCFILFSHCFFSCSLVFKKCNLYWDVSGMLFQVKNNEINKSVFLNKLIIIINKTIKGALHVTDKAQEKELKP